MQAEPARFQNRGLSPPAFKIIRRRMILRGRDIGKGYFAAAVYSTHMYEFCTE